MKKKYVSRLLAGCLTVTMLTPTGALASVPQPVVTQEASQVAGQENETENKEQAEEYAADSATEVQTDETEAAENRTAADKSREQAEPQTAQTGEQAEPQTTQTGEQAASEAEPQAQVQPRAVVAVNQWIRNGNRWWYRHADGSFTTNGWEVIYGAWYYFDGAGWMVTGWKQVNGSWYYMDASGAMVKNAWAGDYYLGADGAMATNTWIGQYYVDGSGNWIPNKQKEPEKQEIALQSISLNQTSLEMWAGESETLEVTYNPSNTTVDKKIIWSSSDESVATVEDGKVKTVGKGEATITAEVDGKKASCTITAKEYYTLNVAVTDFLPVGRSEFVQVYAPDGSWYGGAEEVKMYSLNEDIAEFNGNYVKGISDGIATIVVEGDGRIGTATVVVKTAQKLQNPYFEQSVYNMKMGDKRQLEVSTLPENAWISAYGWKSSNPKVAEVDWDGVVRAMSEGETTITCSVQEGSLEAGFSPDNKNPYITVSCTIKVEGVGDNTELDKIEWKYTGSDTRFEHVKVGDIITPNIQVYPVTYPYDLNDVEVSIVKSGHSGPAYDTGFEAEDGIVEIVDGNKIKICKPGTAWVNVVLDGKKTQVILECLEN